MEDNAVIAKGFIVAYFVIIGDFSWIYFSKEENKDIQEEIKIIIRTTFCETISNISDKKLENKKIIQLHY